MGRRQAAGPRSRFVPIRAGSTSPCYPAAPFRAEAGPGAGPLVDPGDPFGGRLRGIATRRGFRGLRGAGPDGPSGRDCRGVPIGPVRPIGGHPSGRCKVMSRRAVSAARYPRLIRAGCRERRRESPMRCGRSFAPWAAALILLPLGCAGTGRRADPADGASPGPRLLRRFGPADGTSPRPRLLRPADPLARLTPAPISTGPSNSALAPGDPGSYTRVLPIRASTAATARSGAPRAVDDGRLDEPDVLGSRPLDRRAVAARRGPAALRREAGTGRRPSAPALSALPSWNSPADQAAKAVEAGGSRSNPMPMLAFGLDLETYAATPVTADPETRLVSSRRPLAVLGSGPTRVPRRGAVDDASAEPAPEHDPDQAENDAVTPLDPTINEPASTGQAPPLGPVPAWNAARATPNDPKAVPDWVRPLPDADPGSSESRIASRRSPDGPPSTLSVGPMDDPEVSAPSGSPWPVAESRPRRPLLGRLKWVREIIPGLDRESDGAGIDPEPSPEEDLRGDRPRRWLRFPTRGRVEADQAARSIRPQSR